MVCCTLMVGGAHCVTWCCYVWVGSMHGLEVGCSVNSVGVLSMMVSSVLVI